MSAINTSNQNINTLYRNNRQPKFICKILFNRIKIYDLKIHKYKILIVMFFLGNVPEVCTLALCSGNS